MRRDLFIVLAASAVMVTGCIANRAVAPRTAPSEHIRSVSSAEPTAAFAPSTNPTLPVVADVKRVHGPADSGYAWAMPPARLTQAQLSRQLVRLLDPSTTPTVEVDAAPALFKRRAVRNAIARRLQRFGDLGYPGTSTDSHFVSTLVFKPYGALPFTKDGSRYRIFGVLTGSGWRMFGDMPNLDSGQSLLVWIDLDLDPVPRVTELVWIGSLDLLEYSDGLEHVPGWVLDRLHSTPLVEGLSMEMENDVPGVRAATVRLVQDWTAHHVRPGMTQPVPTGWLAAPHAHPYKASARQLTQSEVNKVFRRIDESQVDPDVLDSEWLKTLGPDKGGPVVTGFTTYNDIADRHYLVNRQTKKALEVLGFSEYKNPVFIKDALIIDLVLDDFYGAQTTLLHCEIDWKTMKVRRAVPMGSLSPF